MKGYAPNLRDGYSQNKIMYRTPISSPTQPSGLQGQHAHRRVFLHPGTRRAFDEKTFSAYIQRSFEQATACPLGSQKLRRIFATGVTVPLLFASHATTGVGCLRFITLCSINVCMHQPLSSICCSLPQGKPRTLGMGLACHLHAHQCASVEDGVLPRDVFAALGGAGMR